MRNILHFFFLLIPCTVWCQINSIMYPDFYTAYQVDLSFVNAAYVPEEVKADFNAGYRFQTGAFKQLSTMLFSAAKIFRQENESGHVLRLFISNEKQGPYISTPRAYGNYAYELSLGEETKIAAGLAFGMIEKYYSGVTASGNTNTFLPDASAGLVFKWKTIELGTSSQQLLNSKTQSLASQLEFKRFYVSHFYFKQPLNEDFTFRANALYRFLPALKDEWMLGIGIIIKDAVSFGIIARSNYVTSIYGEFLLDSENDRIKLLVNYNSVIFSPYSYTKSSMEIGLGYAIR